jgi:hypothetical protein
MIAERGHKMTNEGEKMTILNWKNERKTLNNWEELKGFILSKEWDKSIPWDLSKKNLEMVFNAFGHCECVEKNLFYDLVLYFTTFEKLSTVA